TSGSGTAGRGTAANGSAIAYPYPGYPASPGLAPNHTIVVTGVGQASLAADGAGRAAATKTALAAALTDAKAQADLIASTLSVSITGVLSVSTSVSDYGPIYPLPMMGAGSTAPNGPAAAPSAMAPLPQLSVAVTVAYSIG
ncbi:MAG TPA: SIMPL domain-containing protein, partial [Candidatus Binatus sp.]|nr:SIMPL domain-containing protein [Candidatus Binatus sp.]